MRRRTVRYHWEVYFRARFRGRYRWFPTSEAYREMLSFRTLREARNKASQLRAMGSPATRITKVRVTTERLGVGKAGAR